MNPITRSELVLIVDDEEGVRMFERRVLEDNHFAVLEAANGAEALALIDQCIPVDVVIADLDMPELNGAEMARQLSRCRPDLKVLFVTGNIGSLMNQRTLRPEEAFLEKPFTPAGLIEAVSQLLYDNLQRARPEVTL